MVFLHILPPWMAGQQPVHPKGCLAVEQKKHQALLVVLYASPGSSNTATSQMATHITLETTSIASPCSTLGTFWVLLNYFCFYVVWASLAVGFFLLWLCFKFLLLMNFIFALWYMLMFLFTICKILYHCLPLLILELKYYLLIIPCALFPWWVCFT